MRLTYQTYERGTFAGMMGYVFEQGGPDKELDPARVMEALIKHHKKQKPSSTRIQITSVLPGPNITTLVTTLKENGYLIISKTPGTERPEWLALSYTRIVLLQEGPWLHYPCNQIWFFPSKMDDYLKEPDTPPSPTQALLYIAVPKDTPPRDVLSVLQRFTAPWGILQTSRPIYSMEIKL